jgi:hypothetical protein
MRKYVFLIVIIALTFAVATEAAAADTDRIDADVRPVVRDGRGICATPDGNLLITDAWNNVIWLRTPDNQYTLWAGGSSGADVNTRDVGGFIDGTMTSARFNRLRSIVPYKGGYAVCDSGNNAVRFIKNGSVSTILSGEDISRPSGLAVDGDGDLYISLTGNDSILRLSPDGERTTITGDFSEPTELYFYQGQLYVCDSGNDRIITISGGAVSVLADGLNIPQGVLVAENGIVYISNTGNSEVFTLNNAQVSLEPNREIRSPVDLLIMNDTLYFADEFGVRHSAVPMVNIVYSDVNPGDWYYDAVQFVTKNNLMSGTGNNKFNPQNTFTHAEIITLLAKMSGADISGGANWYDKAINWGVAAGITDGTKTNVNITREEILTLFYNYSGAKSLTANLTKFTDTSIISSFAKDAVNWSIAVDLVSGRTATTLVPQGTMTRAEVAMLLMRFLELRAKNFPAVNAVSTGSPPSISTEWIEPAPQKPGPMPVSPNTPPDPVSPSVNEKMPIF